jgi:casein kinase I family protein HRR25
MHPIFPLTLTHLRELSSKLNCTHPSLSCVMTSFHKAFPVLETLCGDKYRVNVPIGTSTFKGIKITLGEEGEDGEEVAIKFESINHDNPRLKHEAKVYETLTGSLGVQFVHHFGTFESYKYMVMDLLGPSLEGLFNFCDRKFTLKTILLLADQLIRRIEEAHCQPCFLRRITPNGLAMGYMKRCNQVYLLKLSHARVPGTDGKVSTGTACDPSIDGPWEVGTCYIKIPVITQR